jgi:hypothetical protein
MLPLLLGIIGILYQLQLKNRGETEFHRGLSLLFFMTGLAIISTLNQNPVRSERARLTLTQVFLCLHHLGGDGSGGITTS